MSMPLVTDTTFLGIKSSPINISLTYILFALLKFPLYNFIFVSPERHLPTAQSKFNIAPP